jgi:hypothetical protein
MNTKDQHCLSRQCAVLFNHQSTIKRYAAETVKKRGGGDNADGDEATGGYSTVFGGNDGSVNS